MQAQSGLCAGDVVPEPQHADVCLILVGLQIVFLDEALHEGFPLMGQRIQFLVFMLFIEHVAQIGVHVRHLTRQGCDFRQHLQSLLIRYGTLVEVVHVQIDVTHRIVGNTHAVLVVTLQGIVEHPLHLLQCLVLDGTIINLCIHQVGPRLIIPVPLLDVCQHLQVFRHVLLHGVAHAPGIEIGGTLGYQRSAAGVVFLFLSLSDGFFQTAYLERYVVGL